jgi:hypothetical protein
MQLAEHRHHRRFNHGLAHLASAEPREVLAWFGAMQAQDYASARWALGVRSPALTDAAVEQAVAERSIVRTWALRSTLHLVAAADVHWLIGLIGPVVLARTAAAYRPHDLDAQGFVRVAAALREILQGGGQLTRDELFAALTKLEIDTNGIRGGRILYRAALSGCICQASPRGKQMTYALLDEWITDKRLLDRESSLVELVRRYFQSHGPATLRDFIWWSGLSVADARRGIALAAATLREVQIDGHACWSSQQALVAEDEAVTAHLLPAFDEYFLGYENRSVSLDDVHFEHVMTNNGIFRPTILIGGEIVGIWARTLKKGTLSVTSKVFRHLNSDEQQALTLAIKRYAHFLGAIPDPLTP